YRANVVQQAAGRLRTTRWDVWIGNARAHVLIYQVDPSDRLQLRAEIAVTGNRIEVYRPAAYGDTITKGVLPRGTTACTLSLTMCGFRALDPIAMLRTLATSGSLRHADQAAVSGRNATVLEDRGTAGLLTPGSRGTLRLRAFVDPRTFVPMR